jgi:hypothetical protein
MRRFLVTVIALLASATSSAQFTVKTPLMGRIAGVYDSEGDPLVADYATETRIWNRGSGAADVTITDVVGLGNPTLTHFVVPAGGVLDLPYYEVFLDPNHSSLPFFATVQFSSTEPVEITTLLSGHKAPRCVSQGLDRPLPHFAGDCQPIGGPLLRGFTDYIPLGVPTSLGWLTADTGNYRTNLFITNPGDQEINVLGVFRSFDGATSASQFWTIPARSLVPILDIFNDPALHTIVQANRAVDQGAATARLTANGAFYVWAATINYSLLGGDSGTRFTLSQP